MRQILLILMCLAPFSDYLNAQEHLSDLHRALVVTALSLEGTPYRYGGTTDKGIDCSGFVMAVYLRHNIVLPHSSSAQYKECTDIDLADACAGDLVFFNIRGRGVSHVGICLGNHRFIHAATSIGRVCISSLDEPYWKVRFHAAGRRI